jgi:transcriptional regulator with XRE-family HTH domain
VDPVGVNRLELAAFLRARRSRLLPADVGLPHGARRRIPGLRREEVAALAGMSADYYTRLEQRRGPQPSRATLDALARALRLSPDEHVHLLRLAGHGLPVQARPADAVGPGLRCLLERLHDVPAFVLNGRSDLLAWNALAIAVFMDFSRIPAPWRNMTWLYFCLPGARDLFGPDGWRLRAENQVADLRTHVTAHPEDKAFALSLCAQSPEFAEMWNRHDVEVCRGITHRIKHPVVGDIEFDCEVLMSAKGEQRLMLWSPCPGSEDRLRLLLPGSEHA